MKAITIGLCLAVLGMCSAYAVQNFPYGWEDGGTIIGQYPVGAFTAVNSTEQAHEGTHSLKLTRLSSATPQAYVWYVKGLQAGDTIQADFWAYSVSSNNARIWGHFTQGGHFTNYLASANGNSTYASGPGWGQVSFTWTFTNAAAADGLVVEARAYPSNTTIYVDQTSITVSRDTATIMDAAGNIVPEPAAALVLGVLLWAARKHS